MVSDNFQHWANVSFVRSIVLCAAAQGADMSEICRAGSIHPSLFEQAEGVISLEQNCRIMEAARRLSNDPALGLHTGEHTTAAIFGMLGHLMDSAPTILAALEHVCKYLQTVSNVYEYRLEQRGEELFFYMEPIPEWNALSPETACMSVDFSFSGFVQAFGRRLGKPLAPLRAAMRYAPQPYLREYRRLLRVEPAFGQPANFLVFRYKDLQSPMSGYNPVMHELFLELLEKQVAQTRKRETFANEVRRVILRLLDYQFPQLTDVAVRLNMTPRTLQRRLQEEGIAFQAIADSVRSDLAVNLLKSNKLTVNEVAYKLGYAEPSVFRRAFKKWTGYSPRAYPAGIVGSK